VPKNIKGDWKLVFSEDFSGSYKNDWNLVKSQPPNANLVPRKFSKIAPGLSYNIPDNIFLSQKTNGLVLRCKSESYRDTVGKRDYQSTGAKIQLKYPLKYGYVNVRAKLPRVTAGGRYFIGLNSEDKGTITMMEAINSESFYSHETQLGADFSDFEWLFSGSNGFTNADYFPFKPNDFNDFGVHWGSQNVTYYINGVCASFQTLQVLDTLTSALSFGPYPVDDPLYLEISNGLGNWGGYPTSETAYPFDLVVESVQIYQDSNFKDSSFPRPQPAASSSNDNSSSSSNDNSRSSNDNNSRSSNDNSSSRSSNDNNSRSSNDNSRSSNSNSRSNGRGSLRLLEEA